MRDMGEGKEGLIESDKMEEALGVLADLMQREEECDSCLDSLGSIM